MAHSKKAIPWIIAGAVGVIGIFLWKPTVLVYGVQRAGLYASIALPMSLTSGILHIVNLAHGELLMVSAYITYTLALLLGLDPLLALIPTMLVMAIVGFILYELTIRKALKGPELNQLILTFGIGIALSQIITLIYTNQTRKLHLDYVSASMTIGETSFGIWDFTFVALSILMTIGIRMFLSRTKLGKAAVAVGQNPKGASIVGIDVQKTYAMVFTISVVLVGIAGSFFLTRQSLFPSVGSPFTMKSFSLIAMAGVGSISGVLYCSLALGIAEAIINGIPHMSGWSDIVFFLIIIITIAVRAKKTRKI
ncbi:MAG: branched-chain amino acid ABC transporter permease [Spirochaetaceae bacterium]|nr:branched-chain amino acid ABC transporter permease [Spirochaetaceae bacterium]